MAEPQQRAKETHPVHCTACRHYLCSVKIMVNPDRLMYDETGEPESETRKNTIWLASIENLRCPKCKKKWTDVPIIMTKKRVGG